MKSLKDAIVKAINEYNKYRSPEAKAKLVKISEKELILDFKGTFCKTCEYTITLKISFMSYRNLQMRV